MFQEGDGIHFPEHGNVSALFFHSTAEITEFIICLVFCWFSYPPPDLTGRPVIFLLLQWLKLHRNSLHTCLLYKIADIVNSEIQSRLISVL